MKKHLNTLFTLMLICFSYLTIVAQDCMPNTPCNDGNECTVNDTFDENCFCSGTIMDTDNDGSPDCFDLCPNDPNKDLPGACGCGIAEIDSDGDSIVDCLDPCPNSASNSDTDGDGICDEFDQCPGGNDAIDMDGNGTPDACDNCDPVVGSPCNDNNDCTIDDRVVANCNCTGTLIDSDGDNVCDFEDQCPGGDDNLDENNNGIPDFCDNNNNESAITITSCPNDVMYTVPYNNPLDGDDVSWSIAEATTTCPDGGLELTSNVGLMPFQMVFVPTEAMNEVRYEFNDNCGNTEVCMFSVFLDSEIGLIFSPEDLNLTLAEGQTTAQGIWTPPVGASSCSRGDAQVEQIAGPAIGEFFPLGTTMITYRIFDNCENEIEYSFKVMVTSPECEFELWAPCDDGNPCTIEDEINDDCECRGIYNDTDGDGVCDADDICPGGDDFADMDGDGVPDFCDTNEDECEFELWAPCDDGNPCTIEDEINDDCECRGIYNDTDGDGVCDADDICPGGDDFADMDGDGVPDFCDACDTQVGTSCDDGDPCTVNDTFDANCNCVGTFADIDNDGVCDADDICPGGDDFADMDGDGIPDFCDACDTQIGTSCDDGDPCTVNDTFDADCNCIGTFADSDNDGVCDADDQCAGGDDSADVDGDGIPDFCDACDTQIGTSCDDGDPCTINDTFNGVCECVGTFVDSDEDGVCDADDVCPGGDDNVDIDNDGVADACDDCVAVVGAACDDGNMMTVGDQIDELCNCVGFMLDSDLDGIPDKEDICAGGDDAIDSDGDGIPDFCDKCDDCESSLEIQCLDQNINLNDGETVSDLGFVEPMMSLKTCGPCMQRDIEGFQLIDIYKGHRYYVSDDRLPWWKAAQVARDLCGYLAVITSEEENLLLCNGLKKFQNPAITSAFIGLHDKSVEGVFAWFNGEPVSYTNWNLPVEQMNADNRDKVRLLNNGKWDIELNTFARHYIVELPCIDYTISAGAEDGVFPIGTTTVTYQATSICGDTDECTFNVNVRNEVDPYIADFDVNTALTYATLVEEDIQITWSITNSYVTDRFMIFRTINEGKKERIGWFKNDQNTRSLTRYSFLDEDPQEGEIKYYIEQVFDNETRRILPDAAIQYELPATAFNVFPNPVDTELLINLRHFEGASAKVLIYNHLGVLIAQRDVVNIGRKPIEFSTIQYEDGIYRLVVQIEGQRMLSRNFVVTKW